MADLVVKSKLRDVVSDVNVGGDVADELNELASETLEEAVSRAKANDRKTVKARDILVDSSITNVSLVVKSKIRDEVPSSMNVGGDAAYALSDVLARALKEAADRAQANGRKTVQARDL